MAGLPRLGIPMIDRYQMLCTAKLFLAYLLLLSLVLLLDRALQLVQQITQLGVSISFFFPMLMAVAPFALNLAFPAAFGVALAIHIDRLTRNREFESLSGMGLSPGRIVLPLVALGLVTACANLVVSGWLEPHGRHAYRQLQSLARHHIELSNFQPTAIYAPSDGFMITADAVDDGKMRNVLLWSIGEDNPEVYATAASGTLQSDTGSAQLTVTLEAGRLLYMEEATHKDPRPLEFGRLVLNEKMDGNMVIWSRGRDEKEMTLIELIRTANASSQEPHAREALADLWMRLARALTIPLMPLLVLPMIASNPPGRRGPALFLIVGLMMLTHHGIGLARELGIQSQGPPAAPQMLLLLALVLVATLVWWLGRKMPGTTPLTWLSRLHWRPQWRGMTIMARGGLLFPRYLIGTVARSSIAIFLFMTAVLLMIDLLENGETLVKAGGGLPAVVTFMGLRLSAAMLQALPLAAIGGPLFAFFSLRDTHQLISIQNLGVSPWRLFRYAAVVALLLALAASALSERLAPQSEQAFTKWWDTQRQLAGDSDDKPLHWFRMGSDVVRIANVSERGDKLGSPLIIQRSSDGQLSHWITADRAVYSDGNWSLMDVSQLDMRTPDKIDHLDRLDWNAPLVPRDARRLFDPKQSQSARQAERALSQQAPVERGMPYYATRKAHLWALPAMPFVMLLLAMPVVLSSQQPKQIARSILFAAIAGLAFLVIDGSLRIMGATGLLLPLYAVWAAPMLFAAFGLQLLLRSEKIS